MMSSNADKVVADALRLPPEERAAVIEELVRSLDDAEVDALEDDDRARLHAALRRSEAELIAGAGISAAEVLDRLRTHDR